MKWLSRKHIIYPDNNQKQIINKLLIRTGSYEVNNNDNIFFLNEYHEYIRIPHIGDIRIVDDFTRLKYRPKILKIKLIKEYAPNNIIEEQYNYYMIIDYIINKNDELIIDILTNIHRKKKQDITLNDIDTIYNKNINDLESDVNYLKRKIDRLSTHTPYYWKMQKQLSKKEMKLMNAKMNKYEDILNIEKNNKIEQNNLLSLIPNSGNSISSMNSINNSISSTNNILINNTNMQSSTPILNNKQKIEIVWIDKDRKFKNIDKSSVFNM